MSSLSATVATPVQARYRVGDLAWWLALTGLCAVLLAPLMVVDLPPLLDYPNHLGRAFALASLPRDTILARFYAAHWSIIPNLALDLIAPPMLLVLPVLVVGRLLIALAVLLPVLGTVAYNTALVSCPRSSPQHAADVGDEQATENKQRVSRPRSAARDAADIGDEQVTGNQQSGGRWWALGVGLIAYNNCLLYGFLNFSIALGLALLLAAGWLRWREARPRRAIAVALLGAPALFAYHLMGLVFFGLLIGGAELFRLYQTPRAGLVRAVLTRGFVLALVFAAPAALYVVSDLRQLGGDAGYLPFGQKLLQLVTAFTNYAWPLDAATAAVAIALPALCLLRRCGRVPGPAACAAVLLLIAFLAAPFAWKGTFALDTRFAVMLGLMLFAGFVPTAMPAGSRCVAVVVLVLLFVARMALLTTAWADRATDLTDLRQVLQPVRPGQTVYVAEASIGEAPAYWAANPRWRRLADGTRTDEHLGALVLLEHRAYWPFEFDLPSQQPIETLQPYRDLAGRVGSLPSRGVAAVADVCGFDYVLLLDADAVPDLPAERFRLLVRSGFAALYAITRCKQD